VLPRATALSRSVELAEHGLGDHGVEGEEERPPLDSSRPVLWYPSVLRRAITDLVAWTNAKRARVWGVWIVATAFFFVVFWLLFGPVLALVCLGVVVVFQALLVHAGRRRRPDA
jgi:Flp pilus assembly protein TadB